jgi:hypothetical protein
MSLRVLDLLFFAMLMLAAHAMPLYTDESNKTLALVLCGNLHDAVLTLKQRQIIDHVIGADWLESNCVSIDPCAQKSSNEDPIFALQLPAAAVCGSLLTAALYSFHEQQLQFSTQRPACAQITAEALSLRVFQRV